MNNNKIEDINTQEIRNTFEYFKNKPFGRYNSTNISNSKSDISVNDKIFKNINDLNNLIDYKNKQTIPDNKHSLPIKKIQITPNFRNNNLENFISNSKPDISVNNNIETKITETNMLYNLYKKRQNDFNINDYLPKN